MATFNPTINYVDELLNVRNVYVMVPPQHRLNVIRKRLAQDEIGPAKLVTAVSAVEALARSLMVHMSTKPGKTPSDIYPRFKSKDPDNLVALYLAAKGHNDPAQYFSADTWPLFRHAVDFRNLVVHECTYLGQDKFPSLIEACEDVLRGLAGLAGLLWD